MRRKIALRTALWLIRFLPVTSIRSFFVSICLNNLAIDSATSVANSFKRKENLDKKYFKGDDDLLYEN
jgi:hypothetical protein